jgi:hypothetical protein
MRTMLASLRAGEIQDTLQDPKSFEKAVAFFSDSNPCCALAVIQP